MEQVEKKPTPNLEDADDKCPLRVVINEANSYDGKIYYNISCKSILQNYEPNRLYQVVRTYEEFLWLYQILRDDIQYNGILVSPVPRKPDFSFSQLLTNHSTQDDSFSSDWYDEELKNQYVRIFAKTVNTYNDFLSKLCNDDRLRNDRSIHHFLTYEHTLNTGSSKINSLKSFAIGVFKSLDRKLSDFSNSGIFNNEHDEEIEKYNFFYKGYTSNLGSAINQGQSLIRLQRENSLNLNSLAMSLNALETVDYSKLSRFYGKLVSALEAYRKQYVKSIETEDSYLIDTFKHFFDESESCLEIILRRAKIQQSVFNAQKNLDKAKINGKDIPICQKILEKNIQELNSYTAIIRNELDKQSKERIELFKKKFIGYCERQIKISTSNQKYLGMIIESIEAEDFE